MFNKLTRKADKSNDYNVPITFIVGSALGALGTYLFFTEKGATARKNISGKVGKLSSNLAGQLTVLKERMSNTGDDHVTMGVVTNGISDTETSPSAKAHNMINHLKHANGSDSTDAS